MPDFIKNIYNLFFEPAQPNKPYNKYYAICLVIFLVLIFSVRGLQELHFHQTFTRVEATIIEHRWTNTSRLVLRYQYEVDGISYKAQSGSYGEIEYSGGRNRRVIRESATNMQLWHPVGSKITVYYSHYKPDASYFDDYYYYN